MCNHDGLKDYVFIHFLQETIDENFCGLRELQDPINAVIDGGTPMFASTVIKYQKLITAVAVSRIEEHTIAFLGTIDGKLKKVTI